MSGDRCTTAGTPVTLRRPDGEGRGRRCITSPISPVNMASATAVHSGIAATLTAERHSAADTLPPDHTSVTTTTTSGTRAGRRRRAASIDYFGCGLECPGEGPRHRDYPAGAS